MRTFRRKPTFKDILSKLVKIRKLHVDYVPVCKSLPVTLPKELVLAPGKMNLRTKFEKMGREMGALSWA